MYTTTLDRFLNTQTTRLKTNDDRDVDPISFFYELDTAVVVRVVDSVTDPEIIRTKNSGLFGAVLCKPIHTSIGQGDDAVIWAYPFDANIRQYPVKDELVVVGQYGVSGIPYYRVLGTYNSPNYNGNKTFNTRDGVGSGYAVADADEFQPTTQQSNLLPRGGDTIIQSRYGSAIRFTNSSDTNTTYSPSVLISNNIRGVITTDAGMTVRTEDVNADGSSIYITSGPNDVRYTPNVFFDSAKNTISAGIGYSKPTTSVEATHSFSYPNELDGNQIIMSSDRVVIGSKINEILLFSKGQFGIFSDSKFSVDSKRGVDISTPLSSFRVSSTNSFINSSTIYLGGEGDKTQPAILGNTTVTYLNNVVQSMRELSDILYMAFKSAESGGQLVIPGIVELLQKFSSHLQTNLMIGESLKKRLLSDKVYIGTNGEPV